MRTSFFIAAWVLLGLLLPAERSAGQDDPLKPYIFFSAAPDENPDAAPNKPFKELNLRPNQEQTYFVYVHNPTGKKQTVNVQLVSSPKKGLIAVAAEKSVDVDAKKTVRVQLVANKAAIPPAPSTVPGPDGKLVPAPVPGIPLASNPYFRTVIDDVKDEKGAKIGIVAPSAYAVTTPTFAGDKLKIVVSRNDAELVGGPISVKLIPRNKNGEAIEASKLAAEGNNLEGFLAIDKASDGAQKVELNLDTKTLADFVKDGFAEVAIDGFARAYWGKLNGESATAPFGVSVPLVAIPGKPIAARFMAPPDGTDLRVVFNRTGSTEGEQVKYLPSPRNQGIEVRVGANGEAIFTTRSEDWVVEFPTQGVFGKRDFFGRSGTNTSPKSEVKFDATPPAIDVLDAEAAKVADPKKPVLKMFRPGQRIKVIASAKDLESDVDYSKGVVIYLGEKPGPDGKALPGSQVKAGKKLADKDAYEAEFEIPATLTVSEIKIGAIFVNYVGMVGGGERTIKIDYTPPEVSIVRFVPEKPPFAGYKPGDIVRFTATAFDEESDIDYSVPVWFFIGDPPTADGKKSQTTLVVKEAEGVLKGEKSEKGQPTWAASLELPKDIKKETELKVGVMFTNGVGMPGVRVATIKVDFDAGHGTVKVKAEQGERLQPGVKVYLLNSAKQVAAEGVTDECGVFVFEKMPVGTYTAWAVKAADQNAQGFQTVVVRGGETVEVPLSVLRQPAPAQPQQGQGKKR